MVHVLTYQFYYSAIVVHHLHFIHSYRSSVTPLRSSVTPLLTPTDTLTSAGARSQPRTVVLFSDSPSLFSDSPSHTDPHPHLSWCTSPAPHCCAWNTQPFVAQTLHSLRKFPRLAGYLLVFITSFNNSISLSAYHKEISGYNKNPMSNLGTLGNRSIKKRASKPPPGPYFTASS